MAQYTITRQEYQKNLQKLPLQDANNGDVQQQENLEHFMLPQKYLLDPSPYNRPHPNSSLFTPFLKLFHWTFLVPDVIEYDPEKDEFVCRKGKLSVKVFSYIWLVILTIYPSLICFNDLNKHHDLKSLVGKITWICYTFFDVTFIKCLRLNGEKIAKLLTEGNRISNLCDRIANPGISERSFYHKKRINYKKLVVVMACLLAVIYTIVFVLFIINELIAITTNLYCIFMNVTSSSEQSSYAEKVKWKNGYDLRQILLERYTTSPLAAILLTIWLLMAFSVEIIWVIYLMIVTSGGYYFKRLLKSCIQNIESKNVETYEGIRIFTKVTLLLDDFNKLFGTTLIWIVLASVMYMASALGLAVGAYLAGSSNECIYDLLNIIGFLIFLGAMFMGSDLHRMGQILPPLIKKQFLNLDVTDQMQLLHVLHGTSVVQYDALSNNIGLKGHGFFTISYTFVTSLFGVIITYSVLVVQFKIGEIPLTSNSNVTDYTTC